MVYTLSNDEAVLEELRRKVGENITIIKMDIDKSPLLASSFIRQEVPTFMLFKNSDVKDTANHSRVFFRADH